ncbi:MAG: hypothetical protein IKB23_04360 [Clostridia bacterium]|nr:hypothetical protein [Clostridia bacterium]
MVNDDIKIAVLGGDRRQIYAASALAGEGRRIAVCGLPKETVCAVSKAEFDFCDRPSDAIFGASVIVLPFPTSSDGVRINAQLDRDGALADMKLASIFHFADPSATVVGGKLPPAFVLSAQGKGLFVYDLLDVDAFEIKNAYITAEGALSIAMNSLSKNICGSEVVVTGFGRISKQLCRLLHLLGAHVSVAARKDSDLAFAETLGYSAIKIGGDRWSDAVRHGYDIIYNTVPHTIFDRKFLEAVDKNTLIVELASVPGGFDICAAQELGTNICWALSLPGKYAPESAGALIAECIEIIMRREVRL